MKICVALFALAFSGTLFAQQFPMPNIPGIVLKVWPEGKMPGHGALQLEEITPPTKDNVIHINNVSIPLLTVYPAPGAHKPAPVIVVCPGGGYGTLAYNKEGDEIAAWLNTLGITAAVLKYRVPGNRDGAFDDIQRAVRLVRAHAAEWKIDATKVGVMGFSAGGHLCARLSTNYDDAAYPAIDDVDQLSCRPDFVALIYPAYLAKKLPPEKKKGETVQPPIPDDPELREVAPELKITSQTPPTFIAQTDDDHAFIMGTKAYYAALQQAHVPSSFAEFDKGGHGYGLRSKSAVKAWPDKCEAWLKSLHLL
jgi:acetyl esterase/lipase